MKKKKHFRNLDNIELSTSFKNFFRWQKEKKVKKKDLSYRVEQVPEKYIEFLRLNRTKSTVTWIGHATFLIQICGINILTDPVWARRMGFVSRMAEPGIPIDKLPEIHAVLISHNHYDHLHFKSLKQIKGEPLLLVPDGLGPAFKRRGLARVEEFQWWNEKRIGEVMFTFVPAQHWSKRTLWDTNLSLWGGWVIESVAEECSKTVYFAGDSGYFRGFREIGNRFKNINAALLPIGCYEPEWFMCIQHVTPEQAVSAFLDTGSEYFVPMHYEAFRLGDDTPEEAIGRLELEWKRQGLDSSRLKSLKLGETLFI